MDRFQYKLRTEEWKHLTTDAKRVKFIRNVFLTSEIMTYIEYKGNRRRSIILDLRLLRNCFRSFDTNKLPVYIPAAVSLISKARYGRLQT